jgi:hypothetical protein
LSKTVLSLRLSIYLSSGQERRSKKRQKSWRRREMMMKRIT